MHQAVPWAMFQLQELSPEHEAGFLHAMEDFRAKAPEVLEHFGNTKWDAKKFKDYVKRAQADRMDWRPKAGKVSQTTYVLIHEGFIYGIGQMRFPIDAEVEEDGGNLRIAVPPTVRKQGFGALVLNRMLFEAVRAGLARLFISCLSTDLGYRKCIEKNRGVLASDSGGRARYTIGLR